MVSLSYGWKANLVVLAAAPFGMLFRAYALATLWRWFVVPLGLPTLGLAHAYGVAALGSLAVTYVPAFKDKDVIDVDTRYERAASSSEVRIWMITKIAMMAVVPGLALLFGYAAHYLMGQ